MEANIEPINIESMQRVKVLANSGLTYEQIEIVRHLEDAMDRFKIFNKFARIAILSVVWKESSFKIKSEIPYCNTPNANIRAVFTWRVSKYTELELNTLKASPKDFFDVVYGNMYDNDLHEGYKYRGRGLNQLTFKANYTAIQKIISNNGFSHINIVEYPDSLLSSVGVAAACCVAYMVNRFGTSHTLDFDNMNDATLSVFRANAGWGKNISGDFHQKTLLKVRNYAQFFSYETI